MNKASGGDGIPVGLFQILKRWCCESAALNMPANLEDSAVATGLEKAYTYRMLVARKPIEMAPSTSDPKKNSFVLSQLGGTINHKR